MSVIRNQDTNTEDFRLNSNRIMRILLEFAISQLETIQNIQQSPCSDYYHTKLKDKYCAVTIMRAGNSFLHELNIILPSIRVGQILLQRDESSRDKSPILYYTKLPRDIKNDKILLTDPMLATGGSVNKAIEVLIEKGIIEENITFVNLIACEQGLLNLFKKYPKVKVITAQVDPHLNNSKYIVPGLGDFGDRYFGTVQ